MSDRRAALEAIAFGDDPRIAPADRMRALELLGPEPEDAGTAELANELAKTDGGALHVDVDRLTAANVHAALEDPGAWPATARALEDVATGRRWPGWVAQLVEEARRRREEELEAAPEPAAAAEDEAPEDEPAERAPSREDELAELRRQTWELDRWSDEGPPRRPGRLLGDY